MKTICAFLLIFSAGCSASYQHYADLGRNALGQGEYRQAYDFFDLADAMSPEGKDYQTQLTSVSRALGQQFLEKQQCDEASKAFDRAEQHKKLSDEEALTDRRALYDCYLQNDPTPQAEIAVLRHMLELGEKRLRLIRHLTELETEVGGDSGVTTLLAIDAETPLNHTDRQALVNGLIALRREAEALPHQETLVNASPADIIAQFKLADLCERLGSTERATKIYEKILNDHSQNPAVYLRFGDFLRRIGNIKRAQYLKDEADRIRGIDVSPRNLRSLPKSRR